MKTPRHILVPIYIIMLLSSCQNTINKKLQMADGCLDRNSVDSAYNILTNINPEDLDCKASRALYSLLYTKAKYRKYIPVKNDSIDYAIFYYEQNGPSERLADALNYKAMTLFCYRKINKEAIECLKKAEAIAIKLDNTTLKQKTCENICIVNLWSNHYKKALEYGQKALGYAREIKDTTSIAYDLLYISNAYSELNMNDKAMAYYLKANFYYKYYDKLNQTILLGNISEYFLKNGNTRKAQEFLNEAFKKDPTTYTYCIFADMYIKRGQYAKASKIMDQAPKTINNFEQLKKLSTLYNLNRKSKKYAKALDLADSIIELNKQTDSIKEHDNLNDIQAKYDREIAAKKYESHIIYIIGALLMLVLLMILLILRQKYKNSQIRQSIIQNRMLINEYKKRLSETENSQTKSTSKISFLEQKINNLERKEAKTVFNGKLCYENVMNNNTIVNWSIQDFRNFIVYYKLIDLPFVSSLDDEYRNLSPKQYLYLIMVNAMNKDEGTIEKIMGVSHVTIRSIKSRIKAKKK
jgi:tetratricopeptide (TPR) repeat protein